MLGLLLLADSRLPAGGHGHSVGVEALVDRGLLSTETDLSRFLLGRLRTGAAVVAAAAAVSCALAANSPEPPRWDRWEAAVSARLPAAATRKASWAQGAALLRTALLAWPSPTLTALRALPRVHHPLVLGAAAASAGAVPTGAAALSIHHLIGGACTAAVRLLGLDPLRVAALAAAAGRAAEPIVAGATEQAAEALAADDPARLPVEGSPLNDVLAQLHHRSEATLFAS
ncbi:MAG TPA: urease accessory UreF family protein [Pseudonocardia sp.]|nr:urease accessory UreF family protein [Pseudonocardia sp.]